ncbi:hypothetical protein VB005_10514 [Metarhizium brunneum]
MNKITQTDRTVELLARNRLASRRLPYMEVLDDMVRDMWDILKPGDSQLPYYTQPLPQISEITYEQATSLTSALGCHLFVFGNFRGDEPSFREKRDGMFIYKPLAPQHLEKRKEIKPDQPKTVADAEAEAQWLYAAETMRGVQTYVKQSKVRDMIIDTYGVEIRQFCLHLQKYVWTFLGKGSTLGLPWSGLRDWPQSRLNSSTHPNLAEAKEMWTNGHDLYEILKILGPLSDASLRHAESLKRSKSARDESQCP